MEAAEAEAGVGRMKNFPLALFIKNLFLTVVSVLIIYFFVIFLPAAFRGVVSINPIMFSIGPLTMRWYGFLIALGIFLGYLISYLRAKDLKISPNSFDSIFVITVLSGVVGARIGHVIQLIPYYQAHPIEIFEIWNGGLSIHGAIIAGLLGLLISCYFYKVSFLKLANIVAPQLMLAGAIGRFGNFFNQEVLGRPTDLSWGMHVDELRRPIGYSNVGLFHPVFFYESILLFASFCVYLLLRRKIGDKLGLAYTLVFYSLARIIVEFWRLDYSPILWKFDLAQIVSFGIIIVGLVSGYLTLTKRGS